MAQEWTIQQLLSCTTRYFQDRGIAAARLEAEILLALALGEDRVFLYTHFDAPVNQVERERFRSFIQRRAAHEPLAYITGQREFMSLSFWVGPQVLIPRPETELLVETAIAWCGDRDVRICDMGTGSGAIAVSLAYYLQPRQVIGVDISTAALEMARRNAERHGVKVELHCSDLFNDIDPYWDFDLITANLPYIPEEEYITLPEDVRAYEPRQALLAGGDGLDIYRRLLPQAIKRLRRGGCLMLEIGAGQGSAAVKLTQEFGSSQLVTDLAGRDRLLIIRKENQHGNQALDN